MLKPLVRSVFSAVAIVGFTLSVLTAGVMPGCTTPGSEPYPAVHEHGPAHHHNHAPLPALAHCALHLCCANLATPPVATQSAGRDAVSDRVVGTTSVPSRPQERIAYLLPFAHAPPRLSL